MKKQVSFCYCTEMNIDRAKTSCTKKYVYEVYQELGGWGIDHQERKKMQIGAGEVCPRGVVKGQIEPCIRP